MTEIKFKGEILQVDSVEELGEWMILRWGSYSRSIAKADYLEAMSGH